MDRIPVAARASGLERFSVGQRRKRGSSPKLVLWNNALVNALEDFFLASPKELLG